MLFATTSKGIMFRESANLLRIVINLTEFTFNHIKDRYKFNENETICIRLQLMIKGIMNIITRRTTDIAVPRLDLMDSSGISVIKSFMLPFQHYRRSEMTAFKHSESDASKILLLALEEDILTDVLMLFCEPGSAFGWSNFSSLMESIERVIIEKEGLIEEKLKNKKELRKLICNKLDIDVKDLDNFYIMANNNRSVMDGMRHGTKPNTYRKNPIQSDLTFAFKFLQKNIINWLSKYYNLEVVEAKVDKLKLFPNCKPEVLDKIELLEH